MYASTAAVRVYNPLPVSNSTTAPTSKCTAAEIARIPACSREIAGELLSGHLEPRIRTDNALFLLTYSVTKRVPGAVFEVSNTLGAGFLEKVYERALLGAFGLRGVRAAALAPFVGTYEGRYVGEHLADLLVEDVLVVELKCVEPLGNEHTSQCLNHLHAWGLAICLFAGSQKLKGARGPRSFRAVCGARRAGLT